MRWSVDSETGVLTDVLLCRPDHYRWLDTNAIAHATLDGDATLDRQVLEEEYEGLLAVLRSAGVRLHFMTPEPHLPYQVYTRDSSQTTPWGAALTQLRMPQRRGEYAAAIAFHGEYEGVWRYATAGACEGGDIHIIRPGLLLVGHSGVRTDLEGAQQLAGWFAAEGWEVALRPFPAHFLHLDVLFCMVRDDLALCCLEVLGDAFGAWLAAHGVAVIEVGYREVMEMACNVLSLGAGRVISPRHSTGVNAALRGRGLQVFDPPLQTFARGGGSVHCMTMPLRREPLP